MHALLQALASGDLPIAALLAVARVLPIAMIAPWLAIPNATIWHRVGTLAVLSVVVLPFVAPIDDIQALPAAVLREFSIGTLFALASALPFWGMEWGGSLIDRWRGAPADSPSFIFESRTSPLGTLFSMAALATFFATGGARIAIALLAKGIGHTPERSGGQELAFAAAETVGQALAFAATVAVPTALSLLAFDVTLGVAGRVGSRFPSYVVTTTLRPIVALLVASLTLVLLLQNFGDILRAALHW